MIETGKARWYYRLAATGKARVFWIARKEGRGLVAVHRRVGPAAVQTPPFSDATAQAAEGLELSVVLAGELRQLGLPSSPASWKMAGTSGSDRKFS